MLQKRSRLPGFAKNLVLLGASLVFALTFFEAGLRVAGYDRPPAPLPSKTDWALVQDRLWCEHNPKLGWTNQKNKTAVLKLSNSEVELHTNSAGMRGRREYSPAKPEAAPRIAVLGDSFAFGWGVKDDETFSAQLEKGVPNLEALNFGVVGYGVDQILLAYHELARAYRPDIVLISVFPEDFWRAKRAFADTGHAKPYFVLDARGNLHKKNDPVPLPFTLTTDQFPLLFEDSPLEHLLHRSLVYRLIQRRWNRSKTKLPWIDPDSSDEWRIGRPILAQLVREIRADGAVPVLVVLPPERLVRSRRRETLYKSILRFGNQENLDTIDLFPVFLKAVDEKSIAEYYIQKDGHWNEQGHALAAREILEFLRRRGLLAES